MRIALIIPTAGGRLIHFETGGNAWRLTSFIVNLNSVNEVEVPRQTPEAVKVFPKPLRPGGQTRVPGLRAGPIDTVTSTITYIGLGGQGSGYCLSKIGVAKIVSLDDLVPLGFEFA